MLDIYFYKYQLYSSHPNENFSSVENPRYVIGVLLPVIYHGEVQHGMFADEYRELGLDFPTEIVYRYDEVYKRFIVRVLGFGVFLSKQTGY